MSKLMKVEDGHCKHVYNAYGEHIGWTEMTSSNQRRRPKEFREDEAERFNGFCVPKKSNINTTYNIKQEKNMNSMIWEDFLRNAVEHYNPQKYGIEIQKRVLGKNNFVILPNSAEGDGLKQKLVVEVKSSIIFPRRKTKKYNIVQYRPYEDIDEYIIIFCEVCENGSVDTNVFKVLSKDMNKMPKKWSNAHGKEKNNFRQGKVELRKSITKGDKDWQWLQQYKTKEINL